VPVTRPTSRSSDIAALLIVASLAIFAGLGNGTFWEPDEPRFAEATRQMFARGDFVTPYLNGAPRFEKPILFYWAQAAAFTAFGDNELAARLPSALAGVGIVVVLYLLGAEIASRRAAFIAALVMSTMFRFVTFARIGLTDVPVIFFIVAALYGFVRAVQPASGGDRWWGPASAGPSAGWALVAWACIGLGVLTKGPVGLLPVAIWAIYATFTRNWSVFARTRPLIGTAIALAIVLPWYVVMVVQHGRAFTDFALGHEIVERMLSEESFGAPARGFFYYFKIWPGDAAPWSALFVASIGWIAWRWSSLDRAARQAIIFAAVWFITVFLVFSVSRSKVPHYVLPAYPAAALLIGVFVDRLADTRDDVLWWGVPMAVIALTSVLAAAVTGLFLDVLAPGDTIVKWLVPGVFGIGAAAIAAAIWKRTLVPAMYALTCMLAAVFGLIGEFVVPRIIEPFKPMPLLARQASEFSQGDAPIGLLGRYGLSSLIYYSRRHVVALDGDDETVMFLSTHPGAVCVMPMSDFERLAPRLLGVDRIAVAEEFNVRIERLRDRQKTPGRLWVLVGHPAGASTPPRQGSSKS
jgi:4-amino-4-deoxy-L-arabinose transferase-like glycosyltransferase